MRILADIREIECAYLGHHSDDELLGTLDLSLVDVLYHAMESLLISIALDEEEFVFFVTKHPPSW
ncbi:MAG: hypothetical protein WAW59_05465 [Patescibacteria group bacterium]